MPDANLISAKIVSVPKPTSWSNAYNAGKLFVVLSLEKEIVSEQSPDALNILGKDLLAKLEEEFFTLNSKNLESIKQAISKTFESIQDDVNYSFAASFFVHNTLYLFTIGKGTVFIRRDLKIAKSSSPTQENYKSLLSSSGYLKNNDLIILSTSPISNIVNKESFSSLDNQEPSEIAEILSPKIQEGEDGKTAAIIIRYSEPKPQETPKKIQDETPRVGKNYISLLRKYLPAIKNVRFGHKNKVSITLAVIILVIFVLSVSFAIKKQNSAKIKASFNKVYPEAEKRLNQGNSLLSLNKNVARENFFEAKKILEDAKPTFSKSPKEEKQILNLLQKANDALNLSSGVNLIKAKSVDIQSSNFLLLQSINPLANQFTQDDKKIYFVDSKNVFSVEKGKEKVNIIIKNADLWRSPGGLGVYLGNIYVLDKNQKQSPAPNGAGQILKFVETDSGYNKTNYLTKDLAPDFSKAISIAIDGSIYVLLGDGTIEKFTRGNQDRFVVSRLDKPFLSPSRIFTNIDASNLYILDNGNSRIVVLNKEGVYQAQYQTEILKTAKDFEVLEKSKKIYVLSQNKVYQIEILNLF